MNSFGKVADGTLDANEGEGGKRAFAEILLLWAEEVQFELRPIRILR